MDAPAPSAAVPVETLVAQIRTALGVAGTVATSPAPTQEQLAELGRAVAVGHDALTQIAVMLLGSTAGGVVPPDPG